MSIIKITIFAACTILFSLNLCPGRDKPLDPDPFKNSDEAKAMIPKVIKEFVANPSHFVLGRIHFLCMRVPDDTREGRDVKLTLMLQFAAMIDAVREEKIPPVSGWPDTPRSWGMIMPGTPPEEIKDPVIRSQYVALIKANDALIEHYTIQVMLQGFKEDYAYFIPTYIQYKYTASEKDHIESIVQEQLKNDPKAKDLLDKCLNAKPLLPPESIPSK